VLSTDHVDFDYVLFEKEASLIVDIRGRLKPLKKVFPA